MKMQFGAVWERLHFDTHLEPTTSSSSTQVARPGPMTGSASVAHHPETRIGRSQAEVAVAAKPGTEVRSVTGSPKT